MEYKNEKRICQNCEKEFTIDSEDFNFYEKMKVPPPTFCPECRMQRRFAYRNERTLYRRKCALTGKDLISCFAPDVPFKVIDRDLWWSDEWDPLESGRDYDFSKPFFEQFHKLMQETFMPALFIGKCVNTKYGNHIGEFKNAYLVSASWVGEDVMYASRCNGCKNSLDMFLTVECQFCYGDITCIKCNNVHFSEYATACSSSAFLYNCRGCMDCFLCSNLRNKQNCFMNKQFSRGEYKKCLEKYNIRTWSGLQKARTAFESLKKETLRRYAVIINSQNVTGDNIANAFNLRSCFDVANHIKDCRYLTNSVDRVEDAYDGYGLASIATGLEMIDTGDEAGRCFFTATVWGSQDMWYSYNCHGCNNCFGCVCLKKKSYCIFNKQYSKEEYSALKEKIIEQMKKIPYVDIKERSHSFGDYFPIELSPFAYNSTIAQDYFPKSKKELENEGWFYKEIKQGAYTITKYAKDIPDSINNASDSIIEDIIECNTCKKAFRILENELIYLRQFGIAVPRSCFECRHLERFSAINFPRLYYRQCMCDKTNHHNHKGKCDVEFETSYAPDRPEIIYCEKCYQQEVY